MNATNSENFGHFPLLSGNLPERNCIGDFGSLMTVPLPMNVLATKYIPNSRDRYVSLLLRKKGASHGCQMAPLTPAVDRAVDAIEHHGKD